MAAWSAERVSLGGSWLVPGVGAGGCPELLGGGGVLVWGCGRPSPVGPCVGFSRRGGGAALLVGLGRRSLSLRASLLSGSGGLAAVLLALAWVAGLVARATVVPCRFPTFLPDCWTQWFDRDDPSGTGDWETLSDLLKQYPNEISAPLLTVLKKWFDRDNPSGSGDWELLSDLRTKNPGKICETPQYIQAKAKSILAILGDNIYIYNPTQGFVCRNKDQTFKKCWDYKVRFGCC
uniref:WxxW domain-containing protein n=1 Tax=Oryzias latipes TaxID=8090 RepID=A0A3P9I640_ORYLA